MNTSIDFFQVVNVSRVNNFAFAYIPLPSSRMRPNYKTAIYTLNFHNIESTTTEMQLTSTLF